LANQIYNCRQSELIEKCEHLEIPIMDADINDLVKMFDVDAEYPSTGFLMDAQATLKRLLNPAVDFQI
jgi:hypothetical protein